MGIWGGQRLLSRRTNDEANLYFKPFPEVAK